MKDKTKQKYDKIMGDEKDKKKAKVGEMTEKELLLGRTLKKMREHRDISLEDLSKGICTPSEMAAMESGAKSSLLMTNVYLARMGKSVNKFEFYSTNAEYDQQFKREVIIELWKSDELDGAQDRLAYYDRHFHSKYNESWSYWQRLCIGMRKGKLPEKHEKIWKELVLQKMYFTEEELDYLRELARLYERQGETERVRKIYALMYSNTMAVGVFPPESGKGMDEERKLEILPQLCMDYGRFEHAQGRRTEAVAILSTAIGLLQKNMRMQLLRELLQERMGIHRELWEESKAPEEQRKTGEDAQHLIALDLVRGDMREAFRKVCWLKEEVKWENTILDNLYTILERRLD